LSFGHIAINSEDWLINADGTMREAVVKNETKTNSLVALESFHQTLIDTVRATAENYTTECNYYF